MGRSVNHSSPARRMHGFRRGMLVILAFVYLFVGIAHNAACLDQPMASGVAIAALADTTDDDGVKSGIGFCDHCPTCVPAVLPAPVMTQAPAARPAAPLVATATVLLAGHPRLDTPPPKALT